MQTPSDEVKILFFFRYLVGFIEYLGNIAGLCS
jgi:hypothetical protein